MKVLSKQKDGVLLEHQKIKDFLTERYTSSVQDEVANALIKEVHSFEKLSPANKSTFYVVFDQVKFLPVYISKNAWKAEYGYTEENFQRTSLFKGLKRLYWKQLPWILKMHRDSMEFRRITKFSSMKNYDFIYCGIKGRDKYNVLRTFLCKQKIIHTDSSGNPLLSFIIVEDITSIYNSEGGWCQVVDNSKSIPIKRVFFYPKNTTLNLLSNRELDVLKLVVKKMDSATIAQQLHISTETVKKHRKNMIAKVGAKDMTALIYLCQQANVI